MPFFDNLTGKYNNLGYSTRSTSPSTAKDEEEDWLTKLSNWFYDQNDRMTTMGSNTLGASSPAATNTGSNNGVTQEAMDNVQGDAGLNIASDIAHGTDGPLSTLVPSDPGSAMQDAIGSASTAQDGLAGSDDTLGAISAQQASTALGASTAMDAMKYLASIDNAYLEKYLDNLFNMEQINEARAYDERMSNTAFSRLQQDIKNAGYNPWLALQNGVSQASAGGLSHAASSSVGSSSQATSRYNASNHNQTAILTALIGLYGDSIRAVASSMSSLTSAISKLG